MNLARWSDEKLREKARRPEMRALLQEMKTEMQESRDRMAVIRDDAATHVGRLDDDLVRIARALDETAGQVTP